jgi:hypothetical protein
MNPKEIEIRATIAYLTYANTRDQLGKVIERATEFAEKIAREESEKTEKTLNEVGRR